MANDRRGDHRVATRQSEFVESRESKRRGGGAYDAGPGAEGLPTAPMMDRPPSQCGAFGRTGGRRSYDSEQPRIQDQDRRGR